MRLPLAILALAAIATGVVAQTPASFRKPIRIFDSIPAPESVAIGADGAWYVSSFGKFGVQGDGAIYRIDPDKGTRTVYATGLDDPCGVIFLGATLWVADRKGSTE